MIKKVFVGFGLAASLVLNAKEINSVDELIVYAMQHSPELQITLKEYESTRQEHKKAAGYFLPRVDFQVAAGMTGSNEIVINPDNVQTEKMLLGKLSLTQLLYDFGKTSGRYNETNYLQDAAQMHNLQNLSDKILEVKKAYYELLRSMSLKEVADENLKLTEAQLYRAKKYFAAGIKTKIDISDAEVNVIQAKIELKKVRYQTQLAYSNLEKAVGFDEQSSTLTVQNKTFQPQWLREKLTKYKQNLLESIQYAYNHRFSIKEYEAAKKASQENINKTKSAYYPAFYFNAQYTRLDADQLNNILPKNSWQTTLNAEWNLYEGGNTDANVMQKKLQKNIAESKLNALKLLIKQEVTKAYLNLNEAKDSIELSAALLNAAAEKFTQAQKRYENGLSDYIELQQARQGYIDAKSLLVVDYYNYYDALATIYHATGKTE